jgi:hypothetical protein
MAQQIVEPRPGVDIGRLVGNPEHGGQWMAEAF